MATEQEQRDMELLAPYLNKYGVDPSQQPRMRKEYY